MTRQQIAESLIAQATSLDNRIKTMLKGIGADPSHFEVCNRAAMELAVQSLLEPTDEGDGFDDYNRNYGFEEWFNADSDEI